MISSQMRRRRLFLLQVFIFLCSQLTQTRSQSTLSIGRNEIACTVISSNDANEGGVGDGVDLDLFNYDCSHKELDWPTLVNLIDHIRGSSTLNLAFNQFDLLNHTIYDKSFDLFQLLANTLNLSSNEFEHIETHAFYYSTNMNENEPHKFTQLDLSHNRFRKVPWKSMRYLPKLDTLHFESNPVTHLDFGDLDRQIYSDTTAFESLTKLYFSGCQIETIDSNLFKMFRFLEFIDLSSNNLRHLSNRISLNSLTLKYINVAKNPIECDCELLWFKKFLELNQKFYKRYNQNGELQMCFINTTKQNENNPLVVENNFIDLIPQPDYSKNVYKGSKKTSYLKRSSSEENVQWVSVKISTLDDEQFICELDIIGSLRNYSSNIIELKCKVKSYPKAIIRWMFGQRVLDRLYLIDNKKFKIDEQLVVNNMEPYSFMVESKLIIAYSGSLKDVGREEFSCRTSHIFSHSKQSTNGVSNFIRAEPVYDQKMILFIVNNNKISKGELRSNDSVSSALAINQVIPDDIRNSGTPEDRYRQYIIWIIISACLIFVVMVIVFAIFCVLRAKKNLKLEEQMFTRSSSVNYSYSSIYKRSAIYLPSSSIRGDNSSSTQPLKPDVRREHQESSSIYANINRTPSRSSAGLYDATETKQKSVSPLDNSKNSYYSNYYYNNNTTSTSFKFPTSSFSQDDTDQSYDKNPIESSLILDDTSESSRSFEEENLNEYKEPKFVDLRKPPHTRSRPHLFESKK